MTKKIIWEKWRDPFGLDDAETDFVPKNDSSDSYTDEYETEGENPFSSSTINGPIKMVSTPMGIIALDGNMNSSKIFNFWTGHANFDITKDIRDVIKSTDGVETLDVYTRYRFRVGVGKAFSDSEVMRKINQNVYKELT